MKKLRKPPDYLTAIILFVLAFLLAVLWEEWTRIRFNRAGYFIDGETGFIYRRWVKNLFGWLSFILFFSSSIFFLKHVHRKPLSDLDKSLQYLKISFGFAFVVVLIFIVGQLNKGWFFLLLLEIVFFIAIPICNYLGFVHAYQSYTRGVEKSASQQAMVLHFFLLLIVGMVLFGVYSFISNMGFG